MKKIDTQFITSDVGMPVKQGTLDHLQSAYQEALDAISQALVVDKTKLTILFGMINATAGSGTFTISAGALYYNGEIYLVDAATITPGGGLTVVGVLDTTFLTASNADPVTFTDSNLHNVHQIRKIKLQAGASGTGITGNSDSNYNNFNRFQVGLRDSRYLYGASEFTFDTTEINIDSFVLSTSKTFKKIIITWNATIFHDNTGGGVGVACTFKIKRGATTIRQCKQTILNDGAHHTICFTAQFDYNTPGETVSITGQTSTSTAKVIDSLFMTDISVI